MDQLWLCATAPAIKLWREGEERRWRLNRAAIEWSLGIGQGEPVWEALADELLAQLPGRTRGKARLGPSGLRWNSVDCAPGWLVWLAPYRIGALGAHGVWASPAEKLDLIQEFGRVGMYERDIRTGQGRWDAHAFRLFGLEPSLNTPDFEAGTQLVHPDDRDRLRQDHLRFIHEGGRHENRFRLLLPGGKLRHLYSLSDVRNGPDGRPAVMVGVLIDDTAAALRLEQQQLRNANLVAALELADVAVWRHDVARDTFEFNDVGYGLMGGPPDTPGMTAAQVRAAVHPDDLPAVQQAIEASRASRAAVDVVARFRNPAGGWRHVLTRQVAERDAAGRLVAFAGVSIDQSAQEAERDRLRHLSRSIELITTAAGVGVWSIDVSTARVEWNDRMRVLYGLAPGQATPSVRQWLRRIGFAEDRRRMADLRRRALSAGATGFEVDLRIVRPDGAVRWVACRAHQEVRAGALLLTGIQLDVTERRATEAELQRQQERLSLATRAAGAGIWERDLAGRTSFWSEQMYRLRGLDPADPRPVDELAVLTMEPAQRADLLQLAQRHIRDGTPYERELRLVWPDGSVHWVATVGQVLRDEHGRPLRMTGVNWDITQRKLTEAALRDKETAERASRAKSEFLARMSHELRTPLNAVLGFTELMERDAGPPLASAQRDRLARIRSAGMHLLALIEDVLDMAAIESTSLPVAREPVSLDAAVDDVRQWLMPQADRGQVELHLPATRAWVMADGRRLRQVLSNLLSNAVKYNRPGGEVWLSARAEGEAPAELLHLVVRDNGRGMSETQLAHLFEPFNRLGMERDGIEGVGIGLTIVRHLVQLMGGRVEVRSRAGHGTEFHVRLEAAAGALPQPGLGLPPSPGAAARGLNIVYIEDNPVNVLLVEQLVALRPGVRLRCAVDGCSGLALASESIPDMLLVDMQLPDMDGFEVLRRARSEPALGGLVVIALSANAMPDDVQRARAAGFDDYWTKPIDFDRFLAGLDAQAERLRGAQAP